MSASTQAFLDMLSAERGAAANTLAAYARDLDGAEELIGDLSTASRAQVGKLASAWSGLAPSTVARKASALRQYFGFAMDEGWRSDDPSGALPNPKARRPLPKGLSHESVDALFERAELEASAGKPNAIRQLALLELLYGSGLRATELVSLPVVALPRDAPIMTVKGKGDASRIVPISERAREALAAWLSVRPKKPASTFLFPSRG
ncbi:MAG: tyrosine-type recombinase/integrase, partial [Pseudomonadota bacterium]|nr:tyrosine-type recombinase/integrase [Pseudomonadota bacterium]